MMSWFCSCVLVSCCVSFAICLWVLVTVAVDCVTDCFAAGDLFIAFVPFSTASVLLGVGCSIFISCGLGVFLLELLLASVFSLSALSFASSVVAIIHATMTIIMSSIMMPQHPPFPFLLRLSYSSLFRMTNMFCLVMGCWR